jgi:hypothetical protein
MQMLKFTTLVIIYSAILIHDIPKLKKCHRRSIFLYTVIMITVVYQSIMFVFNLNWPFLHTLVDTVFDDSARSIVDFLKVPSS